MVLGSDTACDTAWLITTAMGKYRLARFHSVRTLFAEENVTCLRSANTSL